MSFRRCFIGLTGATVFLMGLFLLSSVDEAAAETLSFKSFNHTTKQEVVAIPDAEGHIVGVQVREGAITFQNGDLGWMKAVLLLNITKGAGALESYTTYTLLDGSTFISHSRGTITGTPQSPYEAAKITGDIIHGTGRFQGIKGTITITNKNLPPEKGR